MVVNFRALGYGKWDGGFGPKLLATDERHHAGGDPEAIDKLRAGGVVGRFIAVY